MNKQNIPEDSIRDIIFHLQQLNTPNLDKIARETGGLTIAYKKARERKDQITGKNTPASLDESIYSLTSLLAREFIQARNDNTDFDPYKFCDITKKPKPPS